jgi:hypothetical protein
MKLIQIFWIHILGLVFFSLFGVYLFGFLNVELSLVSFLLYLFFYGLVFLFLVRIAPDRWFQFAPHQYRTENWSDTIKQKNTVILLLGFGYNKGKNHGMLPGEANEELFKWTVENTKSNLYLVQPAFWGIEYPGAKDSFYGSKGSMEEKWEMNKPALLGGTKVKIFRIHLLRDPKGYVDTPDAIERAFKLLLTKKTRRDTIILVASQMQIWRARADYELLKKKSRAYGGFALVVPGIENIPYPSNPPLSQIHTRWLFYKIFEVLISRPKDYVRLKCKCCKIKSKLNRKRS